MRFYVLLIFFFTIRAYAQDMDSPGQQKGKEIVGVYQGTSLFIQNPYLPQKSEFCVKAIYLNGRKLDMNYNLSALKIDFENDLFTPVVIKILSNDSLCNPIILNPDAIFFHSFFKFSELELSDSLLTWTTEGEKSSGAYTIEKLENGFWNPVHTLPTKGKFERASYSYNISLEEGANKYRIKYDFGNGRYLYSTEIDYDYYPEPVTFTPKKTRSKLTLSRSASYEIYDPNGKKVMSGQGTTIDVSALFPGDYVIYFDGRDPAVFTKSE